MNDHERWLRENGPGKAVDSRPGFLDYCDCNGNNMDEVCKETRCSHFAECQEYFKPIASALEKILTIGEV